MMERQVGNEPEPERNDEMDSNASCTKTSFEWNCGWFGGQFGGSVWMLLGGISFLFWDAISASVCLSGFVVLNAIGFHLWRSREKLPAYDGIQRLLLAMTAVYTLILVVMNRRIWVSTWEMCSGIALPPVMMLMFFLRERVVKQNQR